MFPNSRTGSAAAGASTKENPRRQFATGIAGLAVIVRGSSRRIMIMRFRPANIRLINRRSNLPQLLLALSSRNNDKNNPTDSAELTRSLHIRAMHVSRTAPSGNALWRLCIKWRRLDPRTHSGDVESHGIRGGFVIWWAVNRCRRPPIFRTA